MIIVSLGISVTPSNLPRRTDYTLMMRTTLHCSRTLSSTIAVWPWLVFSGLSQLNLHQDWMRSINGGCVVLRGEGPWPSSFSTLNNLCLMWLLTEHSGHGLCTAQPTENQKASLANFLVCDEQNKHAMGLEIISLRDNFSF